MRPWGGRFARKKETLHSYLGKVYQAKCTFSSGAWLCFGGRRETGSGRQEKVQIFHFWSHLEWNPASVCLGWRVPTPGQSLWSPPSYSICSFPSEPDCFPPSPFISVLFSNNSGSDLNYHCRKHFIGKQKVILEGQKLREYRIEAFLEDKAKERGVVLECKTTPGCLAICPE